MRTFGKNIKFVWTREKFSTNKKIFQRHDFEIISEILWWQWNGKDFEKSWVKKCKCDIIMQQKSDNYEVEGNDIGPSSGYNNIDHQLQSQGK